MWWWLHGRKAHNALAPHGTLSSDLAEHELLGCSAADFLESRTNYMNDYAHDYGYGPHDASGPTQPHAQQPQAHAQQHPDHQHLLIDEIRSNELRRLHGQAYLDWGGAALYSERQIDQASADLKSNLMGNPHSSSARGNQASSAESELRRLTLEMLRAPSNEYVVVLTSGATAAIKLVGECFPWSQTDFTYTLQNHNSVLGLRELASGGGAGIHSLDWSAPGMSSRSDESPSPCTSQIIQTLRLCKKAETIQEEVPEVSEMSEGRLNVVSEGESTPRLLHLLALPLECNFSGMRFDLDRALAFHFQDDCLFHQNPVNVYKNDNINTTEDNSITSASDGQHMAHQVATEGLALGTTGGDGMRSSKRRHLVLVDASKGCSTSPPDLSRHPVDFLALSYYKIFGYPTGLGALVVRREALALLEGGKKYFSGGTVLAAAADTNWHRRRPGPAGLEDGTLPFTSIVAAVHGFAQLRRLGGFPAIGRHAGSLAIYLARTLSGLRHGGPHGSSTSSPPVVEVYGWSKEDLEGTNECSNSPRGDSAKVNLGHGPTVTFNLLKPDGRYVGYEEVRALASLHGIHLRYGCHCNPGACSKMLRLSASEIKENYESGHVCWDDHDLGPGGKPMGAIRASLGALSTFEEVYLLISLIKRYFVESTIAIPAKATVPAMESASDQNDDSYQRRYNSENTGVLSQIYIYPVKSCAPFQASAWPTGPNGLLLDREWALLDDTSAAAADGSGAPPRVLTQKTCPLMATLRPCLDLRAETMTLHAPRCGTRHLSVRIRPAGAPGNGSVGPSGGVTSSLKASSLPPPVSPPSGDTSLYPSVMSDHDRSHGSISSLSQSSNFVGRSSTPGAASMFDTVSSSYEEGSSISEGHATSRPVLKDGASLTSNQPVGSNLTSLIVCGDSVCGWVVQEGEVTIIGDDRDGSIAPSAASRGPLGCSSGNYHPGGGPSLDPIREWFRKAIDVPCCLVRQAQGARQASGRRAGGQASSAYRGPGEINMKNPTSAPVGSHDPLMQQSCPSLPPSHPLGFANDGQYMVLNSASLRDLTSRMDAHGNSAGVGSGLCLGLSPTDARQFRPNLVVDGFEAYAEDGWGQIQVGAVLLKTVGPCPRCEMLSVDQRTGIRTPKPEILLELASYRRRGGKIMFGVLLASASPSKGNCTSDGGEGFLKIKDDALKKCSESDWLSAVFGSQSVLKVGQEVVALSR